MPLKAERTNTATAMLVLPAKLTSRQATASLALLLKDLRADSGGAVVVDAQALAVFDTSALAVLLECRREALSARKTFSVLGLAPALASMAALYGVDGLLAVTAEVESVST